MPHALESYEPFRRYRALPAMPLGCRTFELDAQNRAKIHAYECRCRVDMGNGDLCGARLGDRGALKTHVGKVHGLRVQPSTNRGRAGKAWINRAKRRFSRMMDRHDRRLAAQQAQQILQGAAANANGAAGAAVAAGLAGQQNAQQQQVEEQDEGEELDPDILAVFYASEDEQEEQDLEQQEQEDEEDEEEEMGDNDNLSLGALEAFYAAQDNE